MNKEEKQWEIINKAKVVLMNWAVINKIHIITVHFIPMFDSSLEVYLFYENNKDISQNTTNGISDMVKQIFLKTLKDLNYYKHFSDKIMFIFDSNENVIKNYQGNYFLRLR